MMRTIEEIKISELTLLDDNPRQVKNGAIERLSKSLSGPRGKELFNKRPCLVNSRDGKLIVYAGNQRLRAAKNLGWKTVPCIVDEISIAQEREETIKDNLVIGEWDDDILANTFDIKDLEDWGMDLKELGIETLGEEEKDEVPEPPMEARAERGKVYTLGKHRVMCGDSTNAGDVALLMDGKKADMVFTDPPYVLFGNSTGVSGIADDKMVRPFFRDLGRMSMSFVETFGHIYVCCDWHSAFVIQSVLTEVGLTAKNLCIWDKGDGGIGANYQNCYEMIWFFSNSPKANGTLAQKATGEKTVNGVPNIWRFPRATKDRVHNAEKPVKMISVPVSSGSDFGSVILDLFLGSGSTLIACEQTGRICYGMEIDPRYVDVVIDRYLNYVGGTKVICDGKEIEWKQ